MQRLRWICLLMVYLGLGLASGLEAQERVARPDRARGELRGEVTSVSGRPVARAVVVATRVDVDDQAFRARTNRKGAFRLRLPFGSYTVQVTEPGFQSAFYPAAGPQGEAQTLVVSEDQPKLEWAPTLEPIATLSGRVVDEKTGHPVSSGQVVASWGRFRRQAGLEDNGRFVLEGLEPGGYEVRVLARGYLAGQYAGGVEVQKGDRLEGVEITVSRGLSLSGVVRGSDDQALKGVSIVALPVSKSGRRQNGKTGADGAYQITGLTAGQYLVVGRKVGYRRIYYGGVSKKSEASPVAVGPNAEPENIDFQLIPVGAVLGRVIGPDGGPVVGADVRLEPVQKGRRRRGRTGADGAYVVADVPAGAYVVSVRADGFGTRYYKNAWIREEAEPVQAQDNAHTTGVDFKLVRGGRIAGVVRVQDSETPIARARVNARRVEKGGVWQVRADREGKYELKGLPDGQYVVRATARGFQDLDYGGADDQTTPIVLERGGAVTDVAIELTRRAPADIDQNGTVNFADLILLLRRMGAPGEVDALLDLNGDGEIDFQDFQVLVGLLRGSSKVAPGSAALWWQGMEGKPDEVLAGLMAESLPVSQGYVVRVTYDPSRADFLGASAERSGPLQTGTFWVRETEPGVLLVTDGRVGETGSGGNGLLARLRFRPLNGETGVLLGVKHGWVLTSDGALLPLLLPEPQRLEWPPTVYRLFQNVPNPFNPETIISFELPEGTEVALAVYNLVGQRVRTLVHEARGPGRYRVVWDGRDDLGHDVSSGVYFYRFKAGDFLATRRMLLVR